MKILFATDGFPAAVSAGRVIPRLFRRDGMDVTVVLVTHAGSLNPGHVLLELDPLPDRRDDSVEIVQAAVMSLRAEGFEAAPRVLEGHPGHELVKEAREGDYDLIVVGSHLARQPPTRQRQHICSSRSTVLGAGGSRDEGHGRHAAGSSCHRRISHVGRNRPGVGGATRSNPCTGRDPLGRGRASACSRTRPDRGALPDPGNDRSDGRGADVASGGLRRPLDEPPAASRLPGQLSDRTRGGLDRDPRRSPSAQRRPRRRRIEGSRSHQARVAWLGK